MAANQTGGRRPGNRESGRSRGCVSHRRPQSRAALKPRLNVPLLPAAVLALLVAATGLAARPPGGAIADRVVILANRNDPDSLRLARHYAAARGVPPANIIALPMPTAEVVTWGDFVSSIWNPLFARLVHDHWIDAIPMDLTDAVGRRKYAFWGHRIAALVVCRGVPLKIPDDPALDASLPPLTDRREFRTNAAAVDAELSLLPEPNHPVTAFLPNPLFGLDHPSRFVEQKVVKVCRLDGPTAADAEALVDHAMVAEREGLLGRAYIDLSNRDAIGNRWLRQTAGELAEIGFRPEVDPAAATFPVTARFDAPVLYFGWYAADLDGPFAVPGFRFPPGAIALHIHSYSASTLRSSSRGWVGPLVARGVTATFGNVYEPYLQLTERPDLLVRALERGATLMDAAYEALPALSWEAVVVGDPLYRPFAVGLGTQLGRLAKLPPQLAPYALLRRADELDAAGQPAAAAAFLRTAERTHPSLVLALALAERLRRHGDRPGAAAVLAAAPLEPLPPDLREVADLAARELAACGRPDVAIRYWRVLLASRGVPAALRRPWLVAAMRAARAAHDQDGTAAQWRRELEAMTADARRNGR